jgi:UbiD family decarboxylase
MAHRTLHHFIRKLEAENELVRIRERVSPHLEITEITDRVSESGGPALLFENVEGIGTPVRRSAECTRPSASIMLVEVYHRNWGQLWGVRSAA